MSQRWGGRKAGTAGAYSGTRTSATVLRTGTPRTQKKYTG